MRSYLCVPSEPDFPPPKDLGWGHRWEMSYETGTEPFVSQVNCPEHDEIACHEAPPQEP